MQAVLLGAVQGVAEFLPVSSSGHLALLENFWGIKPAGLGFEVTLHLGSLIAVLIFFRHDIVRLLAALFNSRQARLHELREEKQLALGIAIACIPTSIGGLVLQSSVEKAFASIRWVGVGFLVGGMIMLAASLFSESFALCHRQKAVPSSCEALWVGLCQCIALFPGVSRSGSTISACLFEGLAPEAAARFSFLLSIPVVAGAGALNVLQLMKGRGGEMVPLSLLVLGFMASMVTSYLSVAALLAWLKKRRLVPFAAYCFAIGLIALCFGR
ncbi:MAG TPA: undecaprenyl-diphosphate phosphatase [Firmicutes bacterium]|nr:undecaprenyl-diphosphate phosphatase [Bacillota bacterium]